METRIIHTAESVSVGHCDKYCDQVADQILDDVLALADRDMRPHLRTATEVMSKDLLVILTGEVRLPDEIKAKLDIPEICRRIWAKAGFDTVFPPAHLVVIDYLQKQSQDIAFGSGSGVDSGGAGDQGVMVGYATDENKCMMPTEWVVARDLCVAVDKARETGQIPWLRYAHKTQASLGAGGEVVSVIVAAHHDDTVELEEVRQTVLEQIVLPIVDVDPARVTVNGTGRFVDEADAGVVGRKIVVDAYGPRVPVGGGAFSGKDPTKVDRSAAYFARHIAKAVVAHQIAGAKECTVELAYGIGRLQPEMLVATTDSGKDVSAWVHEKFPDCSPRHIIESLGLFQPDGWCYYDTACYGHFGRDDFPWERIVDV